MKQLHISEDLSLPLDFITERIAFLARSGIPTIEPPITPIIRLLFCVRPSNITWLIISVIVGIPIQRVFTRWSETYVAQESLKTILPLWADRNAPSPIFGIIGAVPIETSVLDSFPRMVFNGLAQTVRSIGRTGVSSKTTARDGRFAEMILSDSRFVTAVTYANPCSMARTRARCLSQYSKHPKPSASKVRRPIHASHYTRERATRGGFAR